MAFGNPTRYIPLDTSKVEGGVVEFDKAVLEASEVYKGKLCPSYRRTFGR